MTLVNFDVQVGVVTPRAEPTPPRASASMTHLATAEENWTWEQLRDYVVSEVQQRSGVFPRDPRREKGIFEGFLKRWGSKAPAIARYAFEVEGGRWAGAPVSIHRFCLRSDPYFAAVIAERI